MREPKAYDPAAGKLGAAAAERPWHVARAAVGKSSPGMAYVVTPGPM